VVCGSGLLENYVRLTVSAKKYMEMFVKALLEIDKP
jgi:histidinol-phosphate/aromatic aminotransferase/cobyric acid decarboxylase-like protein